MVREDKHMKNSHIEKIESIIWSIFDIIRSSVEMNDSYVLLLYLSLYKDDLLSKVYKLINGDFAPELALRYANDYADKLPENKKELSKRYDKIIQSLFHPLGKIDEPEIFEIVEKLEKIDRKILSENFSEIFDSILYKIIQSQGRYANEFVLPSGISKYMVSLSNLKEGAKVYNPFAGMASFGVFAGLGIEYIGQEINKTIWAIGELRLMAYNRTNNYYYFYGDSINEWNPKSEKYDLVIANAPINLQIHPPRNGKFGVIRRVEHFFIEKGIDALNDNGKLIGIFPGSVLFQGGAESEIRKYLVDNDLLEFVVELPGGLLSQTTIPVVILVINKGKVDKNITSFINADQFINEFEGGKKQLNYNMLISDVSNEIEADAIIKVAKEDIIKNRYNLNVASYITIIPELDESENLVKLGEIVSIVKGERNSDEKEAKFIRIKDLKNDNINVTIHSNDIIKTLVPRRSLRVDEPSILVATRWKTLKPSYYIGGPIYISSDITALRVDPLKVDPEYLISELKAEYVTKQITKLRVNTFIPYIRKEDILSIKIKLPSLQEQKAKVLGLNESVNKLKESFINYWYESKYNISNWENKNLQNYFDKALYNTLLNNFNTNFNDINYYKIILDSFSEKRYSEEFDSLKHTLGRPRQNILSYAESLINYFANINSQTFDEINNRFKESNLGQDLLSVFKAIRKDISFISEVLEKGDRGLVVNQYSLEDVKLSEVQDLVREFQSVHYKFKIEIAPLTVSNKDDLAIIANKTLLKILLENILSNADKHGFKSSSTNNVVSIDLSIVDNKFILDIRNNGKPFPHNFNKDKFILKFSTANSLYGSGLGGYDINRIAEYFKAEWDLILNDDKIFPVIFNFRFPIHYIK